VELCLHLRYGSPKNCPKNTHKKKYVTVLSIMKWLREDKPTFSRPALLPKWRENLLTLIRSYSLSAAIPGEGNICKQTGDLATCQSAFSHRDCVTIWRRRPWCAAGGASRTGGLFDATPPGRPGARQAGGTNRW